MARRAAVTPVLALVKTQTIGVRKYILELPGQDLRLFALPKTGVKEVAMVVHKYGAHLGVAQKKSAELFRKNIVRAHGVPRFRGHFVFGGAWWGDGAEVAFGDIGHFVVVVKHHPALARDAKIFIKHVARKDIGSDHLFDRISVFDQSAHPLRLVGLF